MPAGLSPADAAKVVASLDIDDAGVCIACLGIVAIAVRRGDPAEITREVRSMTPDIWFDGLDEQAFAAVRRAAQRGVPKADAALVDLEQRGGRSSVARAIVRRLAEDLARRTRRELSLESSARDRLRRSPPELN